MDVAPNTRPHLAITDGRMGRPRARFCICDARSPMCLNMHGYVTLHHVTYLLLPACLPACQLTITITNIRARTASSIIQHSLRSDRRPRDPVHACSMRAVVIHPFAWIHHGITLMRARCMGIYNIYTPSVSLYNAKPDMTLFFKYRFDHLFIYLFIL